MVWYQLPGELAGNPLKNTTTSTLLPNIEREFHRPRQSPDSRFNENGVLLIPRVMTPLRGVIAARVVGGGKCDARGGFDRT